MRCYVVTTYVNRAMFDFSHAVTFFSTNTPKKNVIAPSTCNKMPAGNNIKMLKNWLRVK